MNKKRGVSLLAVALTAVLGVFIIQRTFAAAGHIFISPANASVQQGGNITVDVRINPGVATDGVEAAISYDASKLQFVSLNGSSSAYPIELTASGGNGTVNIARGHLTGTVSANNSLVTKVTFKALVGGTSATLGLTGNSTSQGAYNSPAVSGATINLTNPPTQTPTPTPTPDPDPSPSPSPKPSTPSEKPSENNTDPTTPPANAPKTVPNKPTTTASGKKIELIKLLFKRADFRISGKKPFKVYIKYGVGSQLNLTTKATGLGTKHTISLDKKALVPGTSYSYVIVTEDQNGKTEQTDVNVIKTKGYTVHVTVLDKNNEPLRKKKVTLHSEPMTTSTDDEGVAMFEDVAPGQHKVVYEEGDQKVEQTIDVLDNVVITASTETAAPQVFSVVFTEVAPNRLSVGVIAALVGAIAIVGALVFLVRSRKLASIGDRFNHPGGSGMVGGGGSGIVTGGPSGPGTPPVNQGANIDEMLQKIPGGAGSDPGSVISPDANKRDQR